MMTLPSMIAAALARRSLAWPLLALPAFYIIIARGLDHISYGETIHLTGQWSVGFLCAALLVTPLKQWFPKRQEIRLLLRHRRALGVASFSFALLHTVIYLDKKWTAGLVIKEGQDPSLLTGWIAFVVFILLAITSNDTSVRRLGRRWKTLHRSVYVASALTFTHWALTVFDPTTAIGVGAIICLAELSRARR